MARKQSNEFATDAHLESLTTLLADGYTEDVRSLTKGIRSRMTMMKRIPNATRQP